MYVVCVGMEERKRHDNKNGICRGHQKNRARDSNMDEWVASKATAMPTGTVTDSTRIGTQRQKKKYLESQLTRRARHATMQHEQPQRKKLIDFVRLAKWLIGLACRGQYSHIIHRDRGNADATGYWCTYWQCKWQIYWRKTRVCTILAAIHSIFEAI